MSLCVNFLKSFYTNVLCREADSSTFVAPTTMESFTADEAITTSPSSSTGESLVITATNQMDGTTEAGTGAGAGA